MLGRHALLSSAVESCPDQAIISSLVHTSVLLDGHFKQIRLALY